VDIKIDEIRRQEEMLAINKKHWVRPVKFGFTFLALFLLFYFFNILFFGLTNSGNSYNAFLANHFNYIQWLRQLLLAASTAIINALGYTAIHNDYELLVAGHGIIRLVYSCLGLGVISFFTAFVIAYPKAWRHKLIFIISGIVVIEVLNIIRFVLLAIFWDKRNPQIIDHHTIFNAIIYILIFISLYFWIRKPREINHN